MKYLEILKKNYPSNKEEINEVALQRKVDKAKEESNKNLAMLRSELISEEEAYDNALLQSTLNFRSIVTIKKTLEDKREFIEISEKLHNELFSEDKRSH